MATSARIHGLPAPSRTRPLRMTMSYPSRGAAVALVGAGAGAGAGPAGADAAGAHAVSVAASATTLNATSWVSSLIMRRLSVKERMELSRSEVLRCKELELPIQRSGRRESQRTRKELMGCYVLPHRPIVNTRFLSSALSALPLRPLR